jgi:hypothetical protein
MQGRDGGRDPAAYSQRVVNVTHITESRFEFNHHYLPELSRGASRLEGCNPGR